MLSDAPNLRIFFLNIIAGQLILNLIKSNFIWSFSERISLTLSLPIFWQICSLSATFILTFSGILPLVASTISKILIFHSLLLIMFKKIFKIWVIKCKKHLGQHRLSVNQGLETGLRRWSKSPIGDVGSLLWRRRSATLAAKELKQGVLSSSYHWHRKWKTD